MRIIGGYEAYEVQGVRRKHETSPDWFMDLKGWGTDKLCTIRVVPASWLKTGGELGYNDYMRIRGDVEDRGGVVPHNCERVWDMRRKFEGGENPRCSMNIYKERGVRHQLMEFAGRICDNCASLVCPVKTLLATD